TCPGWGGLADRDPPSVARCRPGDGGQVTLTRQAEGIAGTLSGKQVVQAPRPSASWEAPAAPQTWQSEQAWRCPLVGPFTAFGQVGASGAEAAGADVKVAGRAGLS